MDSVTEELTVLLFWVKISIFIHLVIHHVFKSCSEPGPAELTLEAQTHQVHDTFLDPMLCLHHFLPQTGPLKSLSTLW